MSTATVPVTIQTRLDLPEVPDRAIGRRRRRWVDWARLLSFFARLEIKERLAPQLHVRPLVAELFMTDNCNLRCVSCQCWREHTRANSARSSGVRS